MSSSPVETSLPSRGHRPSVIPKRQILEKSRLPSSPCIETSCAVPPATTLTREQDIKKQQKTRTSTPRKLAHSPGPVTNFTHIIESSFDVLNNENNQFPQYQDVSFQPDEVVGEFGYNNTSTCSTSSFPVQPLIDYYQGLPYEAQTHILSFCHVLTSTLHQYMVPPLIMLLNLLRPNTELHVKQKQEELCLQRTTQNREFEPGQSVMMRDYRGKDKWIPGMIAQRTGPVSYRVQVDPSTQWRRHADQIVTSQIPIMLPDVEIPEPSVLSSVSMDNWAEQLKTPNSRSLPSVLSDSARRSTPLVKPTVAKNMESSLSTPLKSTTPIQSERRYPLRTRQPKILEDYVYSK